MKIAMGIVAVALTSMGNAYACTCSEPTVQEAKQRSTVVFRGTIIALRDTPNKSERIPNANLNGYRDTGKMVVFRVTRVWKGDFGTTFEMPAIVETSACWGFAAP